MVSSQNAIASQIGMEVLLAGGNAVDAAVATAFALAVVHPEAGNIGGGGFLLVRANGTAAVYDFREQAPAAASATMFLKDGQYDRERHHQGALAVGVPGTVAGLAQAWHDGGRLPWKDLLRPAIGLAREGFMVSDGLARALKGELARMQPYPASIAQFSRGGVPYEMGDVLKQEDLAKTLVRIAESGTAGFYEGETAALIEREMKARGGLITREDLKRYAVYRRPALRGTYRDYEVLTAPPPSSGGIGLLQSLNVLEGYDLKAMGFGSSRYLHHVAETLRRAFADRARYLGDPGFVKEHAGRAARSRSPTRPSCGGRSRRPRPRSPRPRRSSGRPRATTPRTSRWWTPRAVPWRSPTRSRTPTARGSWCPAPVSCSTTRWATSTPDPGSPTRRA